MEAAGRRSAGHLGRHQGYQLPAYIIDGRVDEGDVELTSGVELDPSGRQAPLR